MEALLLREVKCRIQQPKTEMCRVLDCLLRSFLRMGTSLCFDHESFDAGLGEHATANT